MLTQSLFINEFQSGADENSNLGTGTMLGVETYSVKGVARLTKDTTNAASGVVTDLPVFFTSKTAAFIFAQGDTGKVYYSTDSGTSWTDMTNASGSSSGAGQGLIWYKGYLFAFRGGKIDYTTGNSTSWTATNWQPNASAPGITTATVASNFPFLFPNDGNVYFANGSQVGKIGSVAGTTFNPGGSGGVDYIYSSGPTNTTGGTVTFGLILPSTYQVNCISFLPTNFLALGTGYSGVGATSQIADVILWNPTLSTYETPLRLFSQTGLGSSGVNQIINRNNVLYAVTAGNHAVFATNGTSFNLVEDISLMTTARQLTGTGIQATSPMFCSQYPSGIGVSGNKLYTGVGASLNSTPTGYGNFPLGVWSIAFLEDAHATQCEFPVSSGVTTSKTFSIGAVYPIDQAQLLMGWFDGSNYGIDKSDFTTYQSDQTVVQIESQMMEIGTPLEPAVITTIQINLVRSLIDGQTITLYYRSAFDQAYIAVPNGSFSGTSSGDVQKNNSLKCTVTDIGTVKFIQLRIEMSSGSPNQAWTPEIRNIIVTGK